jgi:branched-chain amino acid transport system substrate-binding protein
VPTYSKSLQETCGIKTTAAEYINVTDTDFTTVLTRIRSTNPGAIYVAIGSSSVAAVVYRQIRQVGFKGTVLCSPSNVTPKLVELAGKAIDGVQTLLFYPVQSDNPMLKAWEQTYRRMIKAEPSHGNALGAQSIELLAYAAEKAGDPRNYKKMAEILRSGPIPTIIGDITFDASGQGHQDIHLVVIRDGKIQAVK